MRLLRQKQACRENARSPQAKQKIPNCYLSLFCAMTTENSTASIPNSRCHACTKKHDKLARLYKHPSHINA